MSTATAPSRTGNIIAALAAVGACDIAFGLTLQLMPLLMEREGWPAWAIGLNVAMGPIGILMAGPFLPKLLGNVGTRRAAFVLVGILVLSLSAIAVSPVWMWFPLRFFFGLATSALFTISETWMLSFATNENRGRLMGLYTSALAVTFAVGPLILPWTGIDGFLPWGIGIACMMVSVLPLVLVKVEDDSFRQKEGGGGFFGFVRKAPMLLFAVGAATLFDNVLISFFTIYGIRNGLDLDVASRVLGFGIIGNVVMFYPIGWLADHWSRKGVMFLTAGLTVLLSLSLLLVITHWLVWPVMMLLTASAFGVYVVALTTMGDRFKGPDLIAGAAAIAAMWGVGGLVGPPIAGLAIDVLGIDAMPVTLAAFYVILLAGLALSGGRLVRGKHMDRQRFINLLAAIAAITVFGFTFGLMFPLLSLIMESQGVPSHIIGYNAAMHPLGIMLSIFVIPRVVRRFGAKRAVIGAALLTAAVIVSYPFFPIFWWWFVLRVLQGFFVSILFAISEAWIVKFAEGAWRTRILAIYTSILALSFGGGPAIISMTGTEGSLPFIIGAAVLLVATIPIFFVKDEEVDSEDGTPLSVLAFARKAPILLFAVGMFAILDAANLSFLPVYAVKKGFDQEAAALALTAFVVGNTVLQFPIGWFADHFPKRAVMGVCGALSGICSFLVPFVFGTWALWPVLTVMGATAAGIYTVALAELGEKFSGHELVTGTASFSTMWGVGALAGSLAAGWSIAGFGPDGLPFSMSAVFLVFVLAVAASRGTVRGKAP